MNVPGFLSLWDIRITSYNVCYTKLLRYFDDYINNKDLLWQISKKEPLNGSTAKKVSGLSPLKTAAKMYLYTFAR